MAYFGKYIRQILSKQEAVIFPGFGSLIIQESKGGKGEDGKIDPPGAIIKFDSTHPLSDGKLAEEYSRGEEIDLEEARQQLLELVDAIKFKLDKGESYDLQLVGKFSRDENNHILFQQDPNWIIDPELFGLTSLDLLELEPEPEPEKQESAPAEKEVKKEELATKNKKDAKEKDSKIIPETKKSSSGTKRRPVNKWKIIWIVIGSLISVLILILLLPTGNENNAIEFGKDGIVIRNNQRDNNSGDEKTDHAATTKNVDQLHQGEENERQIPEAETPIVENQYFVIAGSFQNIRNAKDLSDKLKAKGFPSEIIFTESRLYRVSVHGYASKEEALNDLTRIKATPGLENAWLWKK